jgi:hypothetical protein
MEVEFNAGEYDFMVTGMEDTATEPVSSREAFKVMAAFVKTVKDKYMQQRLADALNSKKPSANFNHLVHSTNVREQWFDFKNRTYTEMAKEWIEYNASDELKEKIKALPEL